MESNKPDYRERGTGVRVMRSQKKYNKATLGNNTSGVLRIRCRLNYFCPPTLMCV